MVRKKSYSSGIELFSSRLRLILLVVPIQVEYNSPPSSVPEKIIKLQRTKPTFKLFVFYDSSYGKIYRVE